MGSGLPAGIRTKLVFVVWAPATATIKQKMVTASSKDALKKKLDGFQVCRDRFNNSLKKTNRLSKH